MKLNKKNDIEYLTFDIFDSHPIVAVYSTRRGGVSSSPFDTMNLGFTRGDKRDDVLENYSRFTQVLGVDLTQLVLSDQEHHNNILEVNETHRGMGIFNKKTYGDIDGLITSERALPLVTFYADCTPIYFYDPKTKVIAMCHAGWKGTALKIVHATLNEFLLKGSRVEDILVGIGPAICKSCYQVDEEVIKAFSDYDSCFTYNSHEDKYYLDLKAVNKAMLLEYGIKSFNIEVTDYCTKCRPDLFFSHRFHGNERGTQIGLMMRR